MGSGYRSGVEVGLRDGGWGQVLRSGLKSGFKMEVRIGFWDRGWGLVSRSGLESDFRTEVSGSDFWTEIGIKFRDVGWILGQRLGFKTGVGVKFWDRGWGRASMMRVGDGVHPETRLDPETDSDLRPESQLTLTQTSVLKLDPDLHPVT